MSTPFAFVFFLVQSCFSSCLLYLLAKQCLLFLAMGLHSVEARPLVGGKGKPFLYVVAPNNME